MGLQVDSELLSFMETQLATHESCVQTLQRDLEAASHNLLSTRDELDRKKKQISDAPKTMSQLVALSTALEKEAQRIDSNLHEQMTEEKIVGDVLCRPCGPVQPTYVLTATHTVLTQVSVSSCPLCCNGYHCNNWTPASCGHTYHPVCLFTHITTSSIAPSCVACGEPFSYDWLKSWGVERGCMYTVTMDSAERALTLAHENEDIYGIACNRLARRRKWVEAIESTITKVIRLLVALFAVCLVFVQSFQIYLEECNCNTDFLCEAGRPR